MLKLRHHGSRTSSSQAFLNTVDPEVAVYSAAEGNTYGHPHDEVINRLTAMGIEIYGTDVHGTIVVTADGHSYQVSTARHGQVQTGNGTVPEPDADAAPTPDPSPDGCEPGQVNINAAPKEELMRIIHIGDERADELISLRPFTSLSALEQISGIGPSRLNDIIDEGIACVGG